ncbi:symporter small accessory protein [Heliorestis convoluta]
MLGLHDPWIAAAYLLSLISTILCIVFAAWGWQRED